MPICGSRLGKNLHFLVSQEMLVKVVHVKAHRTKKEKKEMSHFEKFVIEGNEKADDLAKGRSNVGRRVCGRRESRDSAAGAKASFHCLLKE